MPRCTIELRVDDSALQAALGELSQLLETRREIVQGLVVAINVLGDDVPAFEVEDVGHCLEVFWRHLAAGYCLVALNDVRAFLVPMGALVGHPFWEAATAVRANPRALPASGLVGPIIHRLVHYFNGS